MSGPKFFVVRSFFSPNITHELASFALGPSSQPLPTPPQQQQWGWVLGRQEGGYAKRLLQQREHGKMPTGEHAHSTVVSFVVYQSLRVLVEQWRLMSCTGTGRKHGGLHGHASSTWLGSDWALAGSARDWSDLSLTMDSNLNDKLSRTHELENLLVAMPCLGYDAYFLKFGIGSRIPPHVDPVPAASNTQHWRLNALLTEHGGGRVRLGGTCDGDYVDVGVELDLEVGDAVVFRPDAVRHSVAEVTSGERLVWSVGCLLPSPVATCTTL